MPYFDYSAGQIYFEQHGNTGPVVILIHGLGSSSSIWLRQLRALKKDFRVYVLDLPGHGLSDRWKNYSISGMAHCLHQWMMSEGIEKASLVGLSLGCTVALTLLVEHPNQIETLVLEGPIGGYHRRWNPLAWMDNTVFYLFPFLLQASVGIFGYNATSYWLNNLGVKRKRSFKMLEYIRTQVDFKAVRQLLWQCIAPPYIGKLKSVQLPSLIIRGCYDPMPRRFVRYLQCELSATLMEVPKTRHLVAMEKPRLFNTLVQYFISHHVGAPQPEELPS